MKGSKIIVTHDPVSGLSKRGYPGKTGIEGSNSRNQR